MPRTSPVSMTAKIIFTHPKERGFPARSQGWRRRGIGGFLHQVTREIPGGFPDAAVVKSKFVHVQMRALQTDIFLVTYRCMYKI